MERGLSHRICAISCRGVNDESAYKPIDAYAAGDSGAALSVPQQ